MNPKNYCEVYKQCASAMRAVEPDIQLIAVGNFFPNIAGLKNVGKDINRQVLQGIGAGLDYLSVHQYVPDITLKTFVLGASAAWQPKREDLLRHPRLRLANGVFPVPLHPGRACLFDAGQTHTPGFRRVESLGADHAATDSVQLQSA
jgi:hypothetical protein